MFVRKIDKDVLQKEINDNFEAFEARLPELVETNPGEFALLRKKEIVDFFDSMADAVKFGNRKFEDGLFSVQRIDMTISDLGYYSRAMHVAPVRLGILAKIRRLSRWNARGGLKGGVVRSKDVIRKVS